MVPVNAGDTEDRVPRTVSITVMGDRDLRDACMEICRSPMKDVVVMMDRMKTAMATEREEAHTDRVATVKVTDRTEGMNAAEDISIPRCTTSCRLMKSLKQTLQ